MPMPHGLATFARRRAALCCLALLAGTAPAAATTFTLLKHGFNATMGENPSGALYRDATGGLFGALYFGNAIFRLTPPAAGHTDWTYTNIYHFQGNGDGGFPQGSLVADSAGNLYGLTTAGGSAGFGSIIELSPPASGQTAWTETHLHDFVGTDGATPDPIIVDMTGAIAGATFYGKGPSKNGAVYTIAP